MLRSTLSLGVFSLALPYLSSATPAHDDLLSVFERRGEPPLSTACSSIVNPEQERAREWIISSRNLQNDQLGSLRSGRTIYHHVLRVKEHLKPCGPTLGNCLLPSKSEAQIYIGQSESIFNARLVHDCLTSVPFNPTVASRFLEYYKDTLQFHSTLAYLKTPPITYQQPPVDLIDGLNRIQIAINNGLLANQYEYEVMLQRLIFSAHDSHLNLNAGVLSAFIFGSPWRIVCVSRDGVELPRVYLEAHVQESLRPGASDASPIATIDGRPVIEFLTDYAANNAIGGLEAHSDWNQLMASAAQDIQGGASIFSGAGTFYTADTTTIKLENGTRLDDHWRAIYLNAGDPSPLRTGGDFYNFFVLGYRPTPDQANNASPTEPTETISPTITASLQATQTSWNNPAYPSHPDVFQTDIGTFGGGFLTGYFLPNSSLAVLSIPSFLEIGGAVHTFSKTIAEFLRKAKAVGKTKVLIDLQQNSGGDALLAHDTFKQFFPWTNPYGGSQMRSHETGSPIGQVLTKYWETLPKESDGYLNLVASEWVPKNRFNPVTGRLFGSWEEYFGPYTAHGDGFSAVEQYDFANVFFTTASTGADEYFKVYGTAGRPANVSQPFEANDIVILTDALCASTCSLFVEMMHHDAGVKTVVVGGRPSYGPMQAVGLTRGARSYAVQLDLDSNIAFTQAKLRDQQDPRSTFLPNRTTSNDVLIVAASINLRNQVRKNESTPLQFLYDAADCRIFNTPRTVFNYTTLWQYAADAIWTTPSLCVRGSTGYSSFNTTGPIEPPASLTPKPPEAPFQQGNSPGTIINGIMNPPIPLPPASPIHADVSRRTDAAFEVACDMNRGCPGTAACVLFSEMCIVNPRGHTVQKNSYRCAAQCTTAAGLGWTGCAGGRICVPRKDSATLANAPIVYGYCWPGQEKLCVAGAPAGQGGYAWKKNR
ncbi:hypothetical protein BJ875DRAFT_442555 [Amylocarpus encephaloides]|uniref:CPAF-like PDZ domain-containing protein n=1 Tax=Amylocarpus encephaloides TaxID=45428 RepID=A0A9P7YGA8_9HELO|nr:hypothetical protein BJ875DRAFT_442555 [Amylocarpus encephaloides]